MDWREFLEKRDDWDKQEKDNDKKSKINRTGKIGKKDAKDIVRRTYNGKTPNKFMQQVNSNMAADEEKHSGNRPRGDKRVPLSRVRTHTNEPLRYGGVAEDTPIGASHQSDHQLRTGRKEQYIEPENADLWKSWLEKGSLDGKQSAGGLPKGSKYSGLTPKQRKIQESINNEKDSDNQYYKNSSWESWLEKNDPCWEGYEQYGMKDKDGKKVPNCIKKNNAIETSHKEGEKKEEWNGKFDNSTTRDDAENDDDKAIGEEESLEELTDGKLEEVEKLKAWEIFLDKTNNATLNYRHYKPRHDKNDKKILDNHGTNYDESTFHGQPIEASEENRNEGTGKLDQDKRNWNTTEGERGGSKKTPTGQNISHDGSEYNESTGDYSATQFGTDRILARFKEEDRVAKLKPKKPSSPNAVNPKQPHSKDDYALHDTEDVGTKITAGMESLKSWELFLEKGITYRDPNNKETDPKKIRENALIASKKPVIKSWEGWLDKMQGAGDARFGNQHLTGMEQKPVADDESIELSAESEENNEKQEKTEDKEDKDNKPYKALSQE